MKPDKEHYHQNDARLLELLNKHRGRRCFVVGNGPSLRMADLDRLVNEITFASNRIWLAFDQTPWRPSYYTMCDTIVARENQEKTRSLELPKIFGASLRDYFLDDPRVTFLNLPRREDEQAAVVGADGIFRLPPDAPAPEPWRGRVSRWLGYREPRSPLATVEDVKSDRSWPVGWNLLRGGKAGHSVVNLGIKIAYWMGIREIYVIGVDHNFVVPDTKTGEIVFRNEVIVSQGEINHFHPNYRKPGETWTVPQLDIMTEEFRYARRVVEADGGVVKNASRFSKLDAWERVDFDALF